MPITVSHALSATTPDKTQYEIKPSNWNSAHLITLNISGTDLTNAFGNSNNVSFGTNVFGQVTASASYSFNQSIQTENYVEIQGSTGSVVFANQNNVSFGGNNGTITASIIGSAGTGFTGTNATGTLDANGLALSVGLGGGLAVSASGTSQSSGTIIFADSNGLAFGMSGSTITGSYTVPSSQTIQTQNSVQILSSSGNISFANSNGVTFGGSASVITASYTVPTQTNQTVASGNIAGSGFTSTSTAGAVPVVTLDSNGLSMGVPAWITTYATQTNQTVASGNIVGSGFTTSTTAGTALVGTLNSVGLNLGVPAWLTTGGGGGVAIAASDAVFTSGTVVMSAAGGALTISSGAQSVGFSVPATSSLASSGIITISTSGSTITIGASQSVQPVAVSNSGGSFLFSTLNFSNANNVTWGTSAGSIVTASVAAQTVQPVAVSNSGGSFLFSTLNFSNANNVTWGTSVGSIVTASVAAQSVQPVAVSNSAGSFAFSTLKFSNANNVTWGTSAGSIVTASVAAAGAAGTTLSYFQNFYDFDNLAPASNGLVATSGSSIYIQPFTLPQPVSASYLRLFVSMNDSAVGTGGLPVVNSTFSAARYTSIGAVVYTVGAGASSRSLQSIFSTSAGITGSTQIGAGASSSRYTITVSKLFPSLGSAGSAYTSSYAVSSGSIVYSSDSNTLFTGAHYLDIPFATSLGAGNYWLAIGASTASATQSANISLATSCAMPMTIMALTNQNTSFALMGAVTSASDYPATIGLGMWSTNSSLLTTASIGLNSISRSASAPMIPFQFIRQA